MTIKELVETEDFNLIAGKNGIANSVKGMIACDLLSWVISKANEDAAFITVQSGINTVAVAFLADLSCVIYVDGSHPDQASINRANKEDIPLLTTVKNSVETVLYLNELGV